MLDDNKSGNYFLRRPAAVRVQNNLDGRIRATGTLICALPHAVRQARVEALGVAQEEGLCYQSLCGDIWKVWVVVSRGLE